MKNRLILLAFALGLGLAFYRLSQTSHLQITVTGGEGASYTYAILNQSNDKSSSVAKGSNSLSTLTSVGSYEIRITQNNLSSLAVVNTKGFFQTTSVNLKLQPQRARQFVGDNPGNCMGFIGGIMLSSDCSGDAATGYMNLHVPATPDTPTYIEPYTAVNGNIEGSATTKLGQVTLFKSASTYTPLHAAFLNLSLTQLPTPDNSATLADLDPSSNYSLVPYKDGFIAYDTAFSHLYYYSSIHAAAETITVATPSDNTLLASSLSTSSNGDFAIAYVEAPSDSADTAKTKPTTEVVFYHNGQVQHFRINEHLSGVSFCGATKLCTLNSANSALEVRDASNGFKQLFSIHHVTSISGQGPSFLASQDNGLFSLNADAATGSTVYSYGSYKPCDFQDTEGGHLLCVTDTSDKRLGLFLSQTAPDSNSIDKKIAALKTKTDDLTFVSIVGNNIFITPTGTDIYDAATKSYIPDPVIQAKTKARILGDIDSLGIDRKVFTVNITTPD